MITLRPYQERDIAAIDVDWLAGYRCICYVLPTGGGKTRMFARMARNYSLRGKRVCILVHREELVKQVSDALKAEGLYHGIIKSGYPTNKSALVQVASVQTLVGKLDEFAHFDYLFFDECHHIMAAQWLRVLKHYSRALVCGFTATPLRLDGKGLASAFDKMIVGPSTADLIGWGFLCPPIVYAPSTADIKQLRGSGSDWAREQIAELMDRAPIYGDVIKHWRRLGRGMPTAVFCANVRHAENTAARFNAAGIPAVSIDGTLSSDERARRIDALRTGRVRVITSCDLISEGFDLPAIGCAVLLRPTKSLCVYLQQVGRALRIAPDKMNSIIIDHVGNGMRHGLPQTIREWELTGDRVKLPRAGVTTCLSCYAIYETAIACPVCGTQPTPRAQKRKPLRVLTNAELAEMSEQERWLIMPVKQALRYLRTEDQLRDFARVRDLKPGWVWHVMRSRGMR